MHKKVLMNKEILMKVLNAFLIQTTELAEQVINDSEDDPQYSAVTATNHIKWYLEIMNELGEEPYFSNVEEFFTKAGYPLEAYKIFEAKRKKESEYYIGEQF